MMSRVKRALGRSCDANDRPAWFSAADPEMPQTHQAPPRPEERAGCRGEEEEPIDTVSLSSRKSVRAFRGRWGKNAKRHKTVSPPVEAADGISFLRGSTTATTTNAGTSDFTPYGYVSRPGSTPLSYSLWGSSASTTTSEESYRRNFSRSLCRVVFGCAVLLVILAVLGIVGIAVYLGVLTNEDEAVKYEVRYGGEVVVTRGDSWVPDLAVPESPAFRAKAAKYERMLRAVYNRSFLKDALRSVRVTRFHRNNDPGSRGLHLFFQLSLDRRKMPSHVDNTEAAVQDVLLQELMSLEPIAFQSVAVDIDSLRLARETEADEAVGAASLPLPLEEQVQVIRVEGTQKAPGGKIMVVKTAAEQEEETPTSTVANLIYQFGPWRPVNPFRPPVTSLPSAPRPPSRPDSRPRQPGIDFSLLGLPIRPVNAQDEIRPLESTTAMSTTTTTTRRPITTPTTTTTITTTATTTTTTTTTTTPPPPTATSTTTTTTALPMVSTPPSRFLERVGAVWEGDVRTTTKRNLSKEDLHAYLAELLSITTPRPLTPSPASRPLPPRPLPPQPLPPRPHPPVMVTIPPEESSGGEEQERPEPPSFEDRLVTFQSVLDDHQPPAAPLPVATISPAHTPDTPQVTSYSGVREPLPPRPPPVFRFPLDKFRFPSNPPTMAPTTQPPPSIWELLTTRKPLILNTELVTTTSTDVKFGLPGLAAEHNLPPEGEVTPRPVHTTSSSLAPVYRPTPAPPRLGPVYQHRGEPESLREFTEDDNYVTVPVISGSNVRYMLVNRTRSNYPKVVIVNLQTTPEDAATTPMTPTRGDSRRLDTKFLEDAFKAILQRTDYRGEEEPPDSDAFSKRRGKPLDLDTPDSSSPVLESEGPDSLWSFLRNLSQVYLSDPAVIQQLRHFERAALAAAQQQREEERQRPLNFSSPQSPPTSTRTPFFQHLQSHGSHRSNPFISTSNATSSRQNYTYSPFRSAGLKQQQHRRPSLFTPHMGTPLRHRPVMVELPRAPPTTPRPSSFPFQSPAAAPYTTLFVTGVGGESSSLPQIISISSRSPAPGTATTNSPIHTFVLKDGQTMEELLQEIFDTISLEEENETYPSTDTPVTPDMETTFSVSDAPHQTTPDAQARDEILESINKILLRHLYSMTSTTAAPPSSSAPTSTTPRDTETSTTKTNEDTKSSSSFEDANTPGLLFVTRAPETSTTSTTPVTTTTTTTRRPLPSRPSRPSAVSKPPFFHLGTPRPSYFTLRPTRPPPQPPTTTEAANTTTTPNYNLQLFPVMTRPMSPIRPTTTTTTTTTSLPPTRDSYEILDDGDNEIKTTVVGAGMGSSQVEERTETSVDVSYSVHSGTTEHIYIRNYTRPTVCPNQSQFRCGGGECISQFSRCNLVQDCRDNSDEANCSCADFLRSKFLTRKICDGIVDCWDHSDESDCEWCEPGQFICSGSSQCIEQSQVCDGRPDCDSGEDEQTCVTIAPDVQAADSLIYYNEGYLMVRKNGEWGKLCLENFERVTSRASTTWTVTDLGQAVCQALTFSDFNRVEREVDPTPVVRPDPLLPPGYPKGIYRPDLANANTTNPTYYKIHLTNTSPLPSRARALSSEVGGRGRGGGGDTNDLTLSLDFEETRCLKRDVLQVSCKSLQCGMRPRAVSHRARIVGGTNSGPGSWPWHAGLYREGEYQCGGTLINPNWLLSAGHCFYSATDKYWVARLGALRRGTKFPSPYEQIRHITHIFIHPQYEDTVFVNDISLLRMESPVQFTDYVRPVCLPPPRAPVRHGRLCTLVGWGQLFEVGKIFPDTLQEVQVPLISTGECRKRTVFIPLYRITDNMFCAGYDRGGRDACLGDSGGPLMCQEPDGRWQLVGVTSNGYGCARPNRPGVYTKVASYLTWMNQVMELTKSDLVVPVPARCAGHRCPLGQCLPMSSVCNGFVECSDGSDEKGCYRET